MTTAHPKLKTRSLNKSLHEARLQDLHENAKQAKREVVSYTWSWRRFLELAVSSWRSQVSPIQVHTHMHAYIGPAPVILTDDESYHIKKPHTCKT